MTNSMFQVGQLVCFPALKMNVVISSKWIRELGDGTKVWMYDCIGELDKKKYQFCESQPIQEYKDGDSD